MSVPFHPEAYFLPALLAVAAAAALLILYTLVGRSLYERSDARRQRKTARLRHLVHDLENMPAVERAPALERAFGRRRFQDRLVLIRLLNDLPEPARTGCLNAVIPGSGKRSLDWLARNARNRWQRVAALELLSAVNRPESIPALIAALDDPDPDVRYAAVLELARKPDDRAGAALADLFGREKINDKRLAAVLENAAAPVFAPLRDRLCDENPEVRFYAATALGFSDNPDYLPELGRLAADPHSSVRSAALQSIARLDTPEAPPLLARALSDDVWFVRAQAAKAAGRLRAHQYLDDLLALLADENWWVRQNARLALEDLGEKARPGLIAHLDTGDRFARNMIVQALETTGAVAELLRDLSKDETTAARAAHTLARVARAGGDRLLADQAQYLPSPERERLLDILRENAPPTEQSPAEGEV